MSLGMGRYHQDLKIAAPNSIAFNYAPASSQRDLD